MDKKKEKREKLLYLLQMRRVLMRRLIGTMRRLKFAVMYFQKDFHEKKHPGLKLKHVVSKFANVSFQKTKNAKAK
jgi:hypothetical protein